MDKQIEQTEIPDFSDGDKVETAFHNFDKEQEIVGKLKEVDEHGTYGTQYIIDTPNGNVLVGTYDVLKSKIKKSDEGRWIKIVCKGNKPNPKTKRTYKDFDVFLK